MVACPDEAERYPGGGKLLVGLNRSKLWGQKKCVPGKFEELTMPLPPSHYIAEGGQSLKTKMSVKGKVVMKTYGGVEV
jgi:hypothetical protein